MMMGSCGQEKAWVYLGCLSRQIAPSIHRYICVCVFVEEREREERIDSRSLMIQKSREHKLWEQAKSNNDAGGYFHQTKKLTIRRPSTRKKDKKSLQVLDYADVIFGFVNIQALFVMWNPMATPSSTRPPSTRKKRESERIR